MRAGVDKLCWETSGRRNEASDRARNTEQHSSMSRKELNVGLAKVSTAAWISTCEGKKGSKGKLLQVLESIHYAKKRSNKE